MKAFVAAAAITAGAGSAFAGVTTINTSTPSDGVSVITILNNTYGGTFAGSVGSTLSNGSVTATRVQDFVFSALNEGANALQLGTGVGSSDQVWVDGTVSFSAEARYAAYSQHFGYRNSTAGGTGATNGIAVSGSGFAVAGTGSWLVGPGQFQWLRAGNSSFTDSSTNGKLYSSIADNNHDNTDHMVTYAITGLGGLRYMLFWEDLPLVDGRPGDYDYNDLAVEIQTYQTLTAIPLPSASMLAGAGLMGVGLVRRRK